jgi:DNA recombination protein RmuC
VDEAAREACLKRHAEDLRKHMLSLSRKDYWEAVTSGLAARPDFVAMYVPGENFFSAAVERNAGLLNEAIERGVFIVTPTTLIALAKAIALGWQQEAIAENARAVAELGRDLYKRLSAMGEHVVKVGRNLEDSVKAYNGFIGSLEGSVLPQARRFRDLQVVDGAKDLKLIEPIDTEIREPHRGRDLRLGGEADVLSLPSAPPRERRGEAPIHLITSGAPAAS